MTAELMRHIQADNCDLFIFDDITSVTEFTDGRLFKAGSVSFTGEHNLDDWEKVMRRTVRPWAEAAYIVEKFVEDLQQVEIPELASHKRQVQYNDDEGDELDYDRLINGDPMWRKSERETIHGPTQVTIMVDVSTPGSVNPENIFWRGGAAVALTKILEERGYNVELWVTDGGQFLADTSGGSGCKTIEAVCLKRGQDPLDVTGICNSLGGWFYRTVVFTLMDTIAKHIRRPVQSGYGPARLPTAKQLDHISQDELRIFVAGVFSRNAALDCVRAELERMQSLSS